MKTPGLSENELVDLITGRIHGSLQQLQARMADSEPMPDVLPELGVEIAKVVAAAIHANNLKCAEHTERSGSEGRMSSAQYYDHLSACIDGY
jgi:hypothetical protein